MDNPDNDVQIVSTTMNIEAGLDDKGIVDDDDMEDMDGD